MDPLELGITEWAQETTVKVLPGPETSLMISSAVSTQHINVTDRQTKTEMDRHT